MEGKWFSDNVRGYRQIMDSLLTRLPSIIPEITDYSRNNPFILRLDVWANLMEGLHYYLDRIRRNSFLSVSTVFEAVYYHAETMDYRIKGASASTVDIVFSLDGNAVSDVVIPKGTQISSRSGILFFTLEAVTIVTGTDSIQISAIQAENVSNINIGQTDGTPNQSILINDTDIVDSSPQILVDGIPYTFVDTFAYSLPTDTHVRFSQNIEQNFRVEFGDNTNGNIPTSGLDVIIDYQVTSAELGNVGSTEINTIDDTITVGGGLTLSVTNPNAASGGSGKDDIATLKSKIPKHRVTLERAVTPKDHSSIAIQVAGVGSAGQLSNECNTVEIYISPIGGGIASLALRDSVKDYFDDKKVIGKDIIVLSAGVLELVINMNRVVRSGYRREDAKTNVRNNLVLLSESTSNNVGDSASIGDIYEVIEASEGVVNSELTVFTTKPYAFPKAHENQLSWSRKVNPSATQYSYWKIKIQSASIFEIFKNGAFLGLGEFGDLKQFDDLDFTISIGGYAIGNEWIFNVYPYGKTIDSKEASLLSIKSENINFDSIRGGV